MNCQDIQKFAFTYLDCEFDARERGEFETHLRLCEPCRATVERDAMFRNMVRDHLDTPQPAPALRGKIQVCLLRAQRRRASRALIMPIAMAAGMAAVAVVGWRWLPVDDAHDAAAGGGAIAGSRAVGAAARSVVVGQGAVVGHVDPLDIEGESLAAGASARRPTSKAEALDTHATVDPQAMRAVAALQAVVPFAAPWVRQQALLAQARALPQQAPVRFYRAPQDDTVARAEGGVRLALSAGAVPEGQVLRGGLHPTALAERSPFGAVRSEATLRTMGRIHAADLPPEITGSAKKIQRYLAARVQGLGALPLSEGAGIELIGARIAMLGPQAVVVYRFSAYGVPLTVFSHARCRQLDDPEVEASPDAPCEPGMLLDTRAGVHLLHVVSQSRVLTLVSELGAPALAQLVPDAAPL